MSSISIRDTVYTCCPRPLRPYWHRVEASDLGYRLARGAFWSLAGTVISRGMMLGAAIVVARMLGKEGFGRFGIIQSTVGMFVVFAGLGLGMTATKHVAEFRKSAPQRAGRILVLSELIAGLTGGMVSLALFVFASGIATHWLAAPELTGALRIATLVLFISALNGAQVGALVGFEAFRVIARINFWSGVSAFPLMVGGTYLGGLEGGVWGLVGSQAVNWVLNHLAVRAEARRAGLRLTFADCLGEWNVLWGFSLPAFLAGALMPPITWACNAMLVNRPNGYAEMGVFNASNQWYMLLLVLPNVIGQPLLPMLSEQIALGGMKRAARILKKLIWMLAVAVIPAVLMLAAASPYIIASYGDGFREHWPVLAVTVVTGGLLALQLPVGNLIAASNRMWMGFFMNLGCALTLLGLSAVAVSWGALGLAVARLIAYVLHATWTFSFAFWVICRTRSA